MIVVVMVSISVETSVLPRAPSVSVVRTHCGDIGLINFPTAVFHLGLETNNTAVKIIRELDIALLDES